MIVVDTNLLVYLCTASAQTALAEAVWRRDAMWAAPLLWRSEFRNVLATLVRADALALDGALRIMLAAERLMAEREYSVMSHEVLQLAARSGCFAYDCEFIALARDLNVPLVTADRALRRSFPSNTVAPETFVR